MARGKRDVGEPRSGDPRDEGRGGAACEVTGADEAAAPSERNHLRHQETEDDPLETVQHVEPAVEDRESGEVHAGGKYEGGERHAEDLKPHARADPDRGPLHERLVRDAGGADER